MANAPRDDNYTTTLLGVDSSDGKTPALLEIDTASGGLLVKSVNGGGGGSDTQYTDGSATVTHPTGTIPVFDNGGTITAVSASNPLPVNASVTITGVATAANQTTGNTSLGTIATDVAPLVASSAGGYVRQDSTATMAKETGGNLTAIATNTNNAATSANQTNGSQQTKVTDGTNTANVVAGDSGFNGVATAGATKTYTFTTSATGAQTILANTSTEGFSWVEVVYTGVGSGLALTAQFAPNTGGTYMNSSSWAASDGVTPTSAIGATVSTIYRGPVRGNFFQLAVSALTSGTFSGYVTLRSAPQVNGTVNVGGSVSVTPSSATGSAVPANAFYLGVNNGSTLTGLSGISGSSDGVSASISSLVNYPLVYNGSTYDRTRSAAAANNTSGTGLLASGILAVAENVLRTAASIGNYVTAMADKFGRLVVIPQTTRDLVGQQSTTITSSTSATTVVTAGGAGILTDITSISLVNSSATATLATLSDGTNSYYFYVPAGDMRGATYQVPLAATTAATAWTLTCGTSIASLYVTVTWAKNQ